jgi:hypothetical protein
MEVAHQSWKIPAPDMNLSPNDKGIIILQQDGTDTCLGQGWDFTLPFGVQTFVVYDV